MKRFASNFSGIFVFLFVFALALGGTVLLWSYTAAAAQENPPVAGRRVEKSAPRRDQPQLSSLPFAARQNSPLKIFSIDADGQTLWAEVAEQDWQLAAARLARQENLPERYRALRLNDRALQTLLASVPHEKQMRITDSPTEIALPLPQGGFGRFQIVEAPILHESVAAEFPEIRTFAGQGIDDPAATVRFSLTPLGFDALVLTGQNGFRVEAVTPGEGDLYFSFDAKDQAQPDGEPTGCDFKPGDKKSRLPEVLIEENSPTADLAGGGIFRAYRMAVAATGEYTAFYRQTGDTDAQAKSRAVSVISQTATRVSGIFERELSVRLFLIVNSNAIYTDAATDPFTDNASSNNNSTMLGESQSRIDTVYGSGNYDFGHLFAFGGGGQASLGSVCNTSSKGRAVSGRAFSGTSGNLFRDTLYAHEIGHQFGANHSFNGTTGGCNGNRNLDTAYEPGSGSTIMGYPTLCAPNNLQTERDSYFHTVSLNEMSDFVEDSVDGGEGCSALTVTNHNIPIVNAGADYTIPRETPFKLNGSATDADGDALTYTWEQYDRGTTLTTIPIFRSYAPDGDAPGTFPSSTYILNSGNTPPANVPCSAGETPPTCIAADNLPPVNRTMLFRLTARDNRADGGSSDEDEMMITVFGAPFRVTAPNTSGVFWYHNTTQPVTWDVGGGTAANVNILLSSDGGITYPTVLAANTANDGAENIIVPNLGAAVSTVRIKIEAVGNIFFDVSNENLTVSPVPTFSISGNVRDGASGVAGITLKLLKNGAVERTVETDTSGYYFFSNVVGGELYTLEPNTAGYVFDPASRTFNLSANLNQDFAATRTFNLGGQTLEGSSALPGVTLRLYRDFAFVAQTLSDSGGAYSFGALPRGVYQLTAGKSGYRFSNGSQTFNLFGDTFRPFAGEPITRNNGRIAFSSRNNAEDNREIYTMSATGGDISRLTNNAVLDSEPSYSPDGSQIVYRSDGNIFKIKADGTGTPVQLTTGGKDENPSWSPDGAQIALVREVTVNGDNNLEIFTMTGDGSNQRNLTNNAATDRDPAWSADSASVYFASNRDGDYEIYAMPSVNAAGVTQFTNNTESDDSPAVSIDNTLVYVGVRSGNPDIFTQGGTNLTNSAAADGNPAFSPDGQQIVFTRTDGDSEIYTMTKTGGSQTPRTVNTATDTTPDWGADTAACTAAPEAIVSWYKGENNAADAHGANNGTASGVTYVAGKVGSGFKFDGVDDSVSIPDSASLKPAKVSVEAWVKFDSLTSNATGGAANGTQYLVFKKNSRVNNFEGYALLKFPDNKLVFAATDANGVSYSVNSGTTTVTTGEFYHVVGSFDGSRLRLFINGNQVGSADAPITIDYGTRPLFFGTSGETYDGKFNGVLDEVTIYNDNLSSNTISRLYNAGSVGKCSTVGCNPVSSGLINWYRGQANANDSAGTNNGTLLGNPTFAAGRSGSGFSFDGSSAINISRQIADDFSIEFWMKSAQTGGNESQWYNNFGLVDAEVSGATGDFGVSLGAGKVHFGTGVSDTTIRSSAAVNDNQWHHVVATRTKADGALKLYVDGAQTAVGTGTTASLNAPANIRFGSLQTNIAFYNGLLDEVKIYNRALSLTEVQNAFVNNCTGGANSSLSINDRTVIEGTSGTTNATFTVTLSPAAAQTVTVTVDTQNVTAQAFADYTPISETLTFAAGETTKTINVPILGDTTDEPNETFRVSLSNPYNALIGDNEGTGTITDDDEGGAACAGANYELQNTLSSSTGSAPPLSYIGTGQNFTTDTVNGVSRTVLIFPAGNSVELRPTLGVIANDEYDIFVHFKTSDAFSWNRLVDFKNGSDAGLYIRDGYLKFYGTAHGDVSGGSRVFTANNYATLRLTRTAAGSFSAYVNGILQFTLNDAAISAATISSANALRFFRDDGGEHYAGTVAQIQLSSPTGNCAVGSLSINDVTVTEGSGNTTNANFTVTLSPANPQTVTVAYAAENITATSGADYTTTSGTLTFAPNETTQIISVPILGDTADEPNETFRVRLSNPTNALIGDDEGIGTITDNDDPPASGATFNARDEFALVQGGTSGVWRYGSTANDASNAFVPYTLTRNSDCGGAPANGWIGTTSGDQTPVIYRLDSPTSCLGTPPDSLFVHPGPGGQRTVLRWVAPAAGTYQLTGVLQRADGSATSDLRILKNETTSLFNGSIVSTFQQPFNFTVTVAANDTIDFSVGFGNGSYNSDGSSLNVVVSQPPTACLTAPANLQVFVPGENSPNDVASSNVGTLVGNAGYEAGKAGQALIFDGDGDYVTLPDNAAQKPTNQLTAEGWFKFNDFNNLPHLLAKPRRDNNLDSYVLWYQGGMRIGYTDTSGNFYNHNTGFTPPAGVWNHYAMTLNTDDAGANANTMKLYINGVEIFSGSAGAPILYDSTNTFQLLIGADFETNNPQYFLNGAADEVSIYGRALTQPEIFNIVRQGSFGKCGGGSSQCVQSPSNQAAWFKGENNADDSQGTNNGTLQNGTTFAAGKVGQAFSFDGDGDYVSTADSANWDFGTGDFALEGWFNAPNPTGVQRIISAGSMTDGANNLWTFGYGDLGVWGGGQRLNFAVYNGSGYSDFSSNQVAFLPNTWHHAAVVRTGSTLTFYLDGASIGTTAIGAGFAVNGGSTGAIIGARYNNNPSIIFEFANGRLDEVSIYNSGLSQAEIQSVYNAGSAGKCAGGGSTLYSIGGRIIGNGVGLNNVLVALSDGTTVFGNVPTDSDGNYLWTNLPENVNYTVTPALTNYTFTPPSRTYNNLAANVTNADFTGVASNCTFTVNPSLSENFIAAGGTGSFAVNTQAGCNWTATRINSGAPGSDISWLTINGAASGTGSGTVNYTVAPNASFLRVGAVLINETATAYTVGQTTGAGTCAAVTPINYGTVLNGSLANGDCVLSEHLTDQFSFSGTAGDRVVIRLSASAFAEALILHNTANTQIYNSTFGGNFSDARLPNTLGFYTLPATGTYVVSVTGFDSRATGNYTLTLHSDRTVPGIEPPSGLVGWYAGEGDTRNQQGAGTGTFNGTPTYASNYVGQSFNLNGTNQFVEIPTVENAFNLSSITVEAWVNTATLSGDPNTAAPRWRNIASKYNGTGGASWSLDMEDGGEFVFHVYDGAPSNFRAVRTAAVSTVGEWKHVAATFDGMTQEIKLFVNGSDSGQLVSGSAASVGIGQNNVPVRIGAYQSNGAAQGFWRGQLDEVSIYNRALSYGEIASILDAGRIGKIKRATLDNQTTATAGSSTVTFAAATSGTVTETPIETATLPALPINNTARLAFDVSTTATFTGSATVCFAVPSISSADFASLKILHREGNEWVDRTRTSPGNVYPNLCAVTPSFSPFVIAQSLAPTAAAATVSGRATGGGGGIRNAQVTLTKADGTRQTVLTGIRGTYRFTNVEVGQTVIVTIRARRFVFEPNTQIVNVMEDVGNVNFAAQANGSTLN